MKQKFDLKKVQKELRVWLLEKFLGVWWLVVQATNSTCLEIHCVGFYCSHYNKRPIYGFESWAHFHNASKHTKGHPWASLAYHTHRLVMGFGIYNNYTVIICLWVNQTTLDLYCTDHKSVLYLQLLDSLVYPHHTNISSELGRPG